MQWRYLLPDTPPSILITNTDSPSFQQKLSNSYSSNPLAVPSTDTIMSTLLGGIQFLSIYSLFLTFLFL